MSQRTIWTVAKEKERKREREREREGGVKESYFIGLKEISMTRKPKQIGKQRDSERKRQTERQRAQ